MTGKSRGSPAVPRRSCRTWSSNISRFRGRSSKTSWGRFLPNIRISNLISNKKVDYTLIVQGLVIVVIIGGGLRLWETTPAYGGLGGGGLKWGRPGPNIFG